MRKFIMKPDISLFEGVQVFKDTDLSFKSEDGYIEQTIKDLVLTIHKKEENNKYKSETDLKIFLDEGEIVLFEEDRGYFLPSVPMSTIKDGKEDLEAIMSLDKE